MTRLKDKLEKITLSENTKLPDLKNISESKSVAIAKWLIGYIKNGLSNGEFKINDILPSKPEFAYKLGVSIGTMQNAFRYIEDLGFVESKQCVGTIIKNSDESSSKFRKLTSKRDLAIEAIKRYLSTSGFKVGDYTPSSNTVSTIIGYSTNTTRLALENLAIQNILEHKYKNSNESGWIIKTLDFSLSSDHSKKSETLVDKIVKEIEDYIKNNLKIGDKIPSHMELAQKLNASIKTVHDALKILNDKNIILSRRGKYGTSVIQIPDSKTTSDKKEMSIFAPAKDTAFYHYEKTQNRIKKMIAQDYDIGEKLPSIIELSKQMDLSPNTIRKAFHNLAPEGYLVFSRGRYGGTFVIDIPEMETQAYKWLAVNPQYAQNYTK